MPNYRRWYKPHATYFFTLKTYRNRAFLCEPAARALLHEAIATVRQSRPFELVALVLLPNHLHTIWTMTHDADFSPRWQQIKGYFSRRWKWDAMDDTMTSSRWSKYERAVWQRRFWEHMIRDRDDMAAHMDYIHYNPVKHEMARCPHAWGYSSFHRWVEQGAYGPDWLCMCRRKRAESACDWDHWPTVGE